MKSILEQFAYGNINPSDGAIPKGSRYERILNSANNAENKIAAALDGELQELFSKYVNEQGEAVSIAETDKFIFGYRLGVLMTMEVFTGREHTIFGADLWQG